MPSQRTSRSRNLGILLENRDSRDRPFYEFRGSVPADVPKYASIIGQDETAAIDAPHPVVLHETPARPVPLTVPWMACYDLDTGERL